MVVMINGGNVRISTTSQNIRRIAMREMDFKMERQGLLEIGQKVEITEGELPSSWYYIINPSLAMSGNFKLRERLSAREGTVVDIKETPRGFYVTVQFLED